MAGGEQNAEPAKIMPAFERAITPIFVFADRGG